MSIFIKDCKHGFLSKRYIVIKKKIPNTLHTVQKRHESSIRSNVFPEKLETRTKILVDEFTLSKHLQESNKSLQDTINLQKLKRRGREEKIKGRLERLERRKLKIQSSTDDIVEKFSIPKVYPRSMYAAYLYLKQLRIGKQYELSWNFIRETFFEEWMGVKSDICELLLQNVTPEEIVGNLPSEEKLFKSHQELLFVECLKHLEMKNDSEFAIQFLEMFFNQSKIHPLLTEERIWTHMFNFGSQMQNEKISSLIIAKWSEIQEVNGGNFFSILKSENSHRLLFRFFVSSGFAQSIASEIMKDFKSKPSIWKIDYFFSELLRFSFPEHSQILLDTHNEILEFEKSIGKNLHNAHTYSLVLQAYIDLGQTSIAEEYFDNSVKKELFFGTTYPSDSLLMTMPLSFFYIENDAWDKLSTFWNAYLLDKERFVDVIHPDELYIAALAFNTTSNFKNTIQLFQRYSTARHNWRTMIEFMKAFGEFHQFDTCYQLLFNTIRDISNIEENTEMLLNYVKILIRQGHLPEAMQAINEYNNISDCKRLGLVHVPCSVPIVLPLIELHKEDVPSLLYILRELWPTPHFDPSPLVTLLRSISDNSSDIASKKLEEYISQLESDRTSFLDGKWNEEIENSETV